MWSDAWVVGPLVLAGVLAVSGISKLGKESETLSSMASLQVPERLRRRWLATALPWTELALAALLLVAWGWVLQLAAVATLALMAAYLVIVFLAVRRPEPADCGCFGELVDARVTWVTVLRNVLLVGAAKAAVAGALWSGGTLSTLAALGTSGWLWLLAVVVVGVLAWTLAPGAAPAAAAAPAPQSTGDEALAEDYLRVPIPLARVARPDGSFTTLRELARSQARLLLFLSPTCGSCTEVGNAALGWAEELAPVVGVVPVFQAGRDSVASVMPHLLDIAHFQDEGSVTAVFEIGGTPSAVLLGADGLVAGGPVSGTAAINEFVADIKEQLSTVAPA